MEPEVPLLDDFVLGLAGRPVPRVLFVPTATGDWGGFNEQFLEAFAEPRALPSVLHLFKRGGEDLRELILQQDVVYVGGGNTANMLAVWRAHGVDRLLREAWEAGVVLAGISAGALCWFEGGTTDSFGPELAPLRDGLGIMPGSFSPHYDGEEGRRAAHHRAIRDGLLGDGFAADDGVGLHFVGTTLAEAVASRPMARAWRLEARGGDIVETPIATRYLG